MDPEYTRLLADIHRNNLIIATLDGVAIVALLVTIGSLIFSSMFHRE